jgi:hypothetical protein
MYVATSPRGTLHVVSTWFYIAYRDFFLAYVNVNIDPTVERCLHRS